MMVILDLDGNQQKKYKELSKEPLFMLSLILFQLEEDIGVTRLLNHTQYHAK